MKTTRMTQAITLAAMAVMVAAVFVSVAADTSDAAEAEPTIADSGFIKDKKALFFYSKFGTSGFALTGGSISGDTLSKGVGKIMQDNTVFASITKLDKEKQYYLAIEEHDKSGTLNYGIVVTLNSSITTTYVYMSVADAKPYSEQTELTNAAMEGCANPGFTTTVTNDIYYVFKLATDDKAAEVVTDSTVENPLQFTKIFFLEVIVNDMTDVVANTTKYYGYSGTSSANYAGDALSYDDGTYLVCLFITNVSKENVQITVDASSKFTVDSEKILYGKNATAGYGYCILSQSDYPNENFDKASVSLGENGESYASSAVVSSDDDNGEKNKAGLYMIIGLAVVIIAAILIAMAYKGDNNKVE